MTKKKGVARATRSIRVENTGPPFLAAPAPARADDLGAVTIDPPRRTVFGKSACRGGRLSLGGPPRSLSRPYAFASDPVIGEAAERRDCAIYFAKYRARVLWIAIEYVQHRIFAFIFKSMWDLYRNAKVWKEVWPSLLPYFTV